MLRADMRGKVYLVGAGPGNPDLITIRALNLLKSADTVLYDRLVSREIISLIPESTKAVCVGTDHGEDSAMKQDGINQLMLDDASRGLTVVRLKCGDPFVFGRGGEEIGFLADHDIRFEIVPGVSSALGVTTFAGIPLTHRDISSSILIISGHRKRQEENDWKTVANFDGTIVIMMGIAEVREIMSKLMAAGMSPELPAAIVQNGTMQDQRVFIGRISDIADIAERNSVVSPGIIVVGKVVSLATLVTVPGSEGQEHTP